MTRVILDTNVFVSGIFWRGPPHQILKAWIQQKLKLIITPEIIDEYTRVCDILAQKYNKINFSPVVELVLLHSEMYSPINLVKQISIDRDDDKSIACALAANCKFIISGDKDLLDISGFCDIEVLKPAQFVKKYL